MFVLLVLLWKPTEQHRKHERYQYPVQKPRGQYNKEIQQLRTVTRFFCIHNKLKLQSIHTLTYNLLHQKIFVHPFTSAGPLKQHVSLAQMHWSYKGTNNGFDAQCSGAAWASQWATLPRTSSLYSHTHGQWWCCSMRRGKGRTGCAGEKLFNFWMDGARKHRILLFISQLNQSSLFVLSRTTPQW